MTTKSNIDFDVIEYLFHLNNANDENGIRPYEGWKFAKVDLAGRTAIEHGYYPTVSVEIAAKQMDNFAERVLQGLASKYPKVHIADQRIQGEDGANHFVAFCADRVRR